MFQSKIILVSLNNLHAYVRKGNASVRLVWRALGDTRGETAYANTKLATSAMYWGGNPLFLEAAERWYSLVVDTTQNLRARL